MPPRAGERDPPDRDRRRAPYRNEIAQTIDLRWGPITPIHSLEDTHALASALERLAAAGIDEPRATPLTDREPPATAATSAA